MAGTQRSPYLMLANVLIPIATIVFATGFFPYKPFIAGLANFTEDGEQQPPAIFDKLIFMVVDSLRSDFVFSEPSGFSYVQSLIRSGDAIPFTGHATAPTITMPRVKAMTTGSVPSFLDVILNFAEADTSSTLADQDTWLLQLKKNKGGKLVFYGDDTWLKLFPNMFSRSDGTSSFFVSDFTEVDNNVTRHVPEELGNTDWNALIMHYLGLDHIGHKAGPKSPNMIPKQKEMDGIVEQIYHAMQTQHHLQSSLLVLLGDHGMNDGGGHGGSSAGETSPALVFMSPKLRRVGQLTTRDCPIPFREDFDFYGTVEQSDLAPTLAGLFGFPVPLNNLGVFIETFLPLWPNGKDRLQLLKQNARQMLSLVKETFRSEDFEPSTKRDNCNDMDSEGAELACLWKEAEASGDNERLVLSRREPHLEQAFAFKKFCKRTQEVMSSTASNYNLTRMGAGIVLCLIAVTASLLTLLDKRRGLSITDQLVFICVVVPYMALMFASSFVEEEQVFWYWISAGFIASLVSSTGIPPNLTGAAAGAALLLFHRIIQRWNQTGQKRAGAPDIVHDVLLPHPLLLWTLVLTTYGLVLTRLRVRPFRPNKRTTMESYLSMTAGLLSLVFKASFTAHDAPELLEGVTPGVLQIFMDFNLVVGARLVFGLVIFVLVLRLARNDHTLPNDLVHLVTIFLLTQSRAQNIPLFLLFELQAVCLSTLHLNPSQLSLTSILFSHTAFFALGNSNAISSVDLANAYNGVAGYNVVAVGVLVFLSNWTGPIWWTLSSLRLIKETMQARKEKDHSPGSPFQLYMPLHTVFVGCALVAVMVACTVLRTHLFIWTVFSPKYLFSMAWSCLFHLLITIGLSTVYQKIALRATR
ncbi:alkaline phosphatase-like protein [Eremomyces bilateralis CBS 781.70]|uniref:GPI ethanolamine phosphate transferase 2 n=1 Tax=Eremomyces bilateralis CBS 781.70 TaxID=1392243 RepID=A0A6G1G1V5_9PEZI|nr:alkaline phosphatase-like protein [Eremomyces bilateralis CBS 781.70]KAF1811998.1 alkaline phosphatase-like protein [Eremomyces bilateralis CBS 781.70]